MIDVQKDAPRRLRPAETSLIRLALDLGAADVGGPLTTDERDLVSAVSESPPSDPRAIESCRLAVLAGGDPLGDELLRIRSALERRGIGAFYTPSTIVEPMVRWALERKPARVVDAGCGSGRFAGSVLRRRHDLPTVAIDLDPVATLLTRATLAVLGAGNARVIQGDYLSMVLESVDGKTAFIGNPPYVRHHELTPALKAWAADAGKRLGHSVSSLSGLHAYFFLATALHARAGDYGTFITSSEWLDVAYGSAIRQLLLNGLGCLELTAFDPRSSAFEDVMTTAVIVSFEAGAHPDTMRVGMVASADELAGPIGSPVQREVLAASNRWSGLFAAPAADGDVRPIPVGTAARLGDIARVHRGQVTGGNGFFVMSRERATDLGLTEWCRPVITAAEDVLEASGIIRDTPQRKVLLCPQKDLDRQAHPALDRYLSLGERRQEREEVPLMDRYVPRHRTPWWHLGKIPAPPIVASYMARRAPAFALNPDRLALLNIGHGLWPTRDMTESELEELVLHLNALSGSFRGGGRTYHGGLEKFEPGEMEALVVPDGDRFRG